MRDSARVPITSAGNFPASVPMAGIEDLSSSLCAVIDQHIKNSFAAISNNVIVACPDLERTAQPSEVQSENIPNTQSAPLENPLMGKPSYSHVVAPPVSDRADQLGMVAQRKGEYISIKIDDSLMQEGVSKLQNTLIGKVSLATGDKPYTLEDLKSKLDRLWGILGTGV